MHPLALLLSAVLGRELDADPVLLVVLPLADVLVAVRRDHGSVAIFLPLLEVAVVLAPVLVGQLTLTFEQVLRKGSLVGALGLCKVVDTC